MEWDKLENARKFAGDPSVQSVMMQAGLTDNPDVYFLEGGFKTNTLKRQETDGLSHKILAYS